MTAEAGSALGAVTVDLEPTATAAASRSASARSTSATHRIGDIEVLRAIAVLFVMVEHMPFSLITWPSTTLGTVFTYCQFWGGVDLFFAISGFVIARSLLPLLEAAPDSAAYLQTVLAFWIRRAWRLLPSAWLWLAIPLALSIGFNRSGAFKPIEANLAMTLAALASVANYFQASVLTRPEWEGTDFVYWSLSLEEQFYLLLPLAAFLCRRRLPWLIGFLALLQLLKPRSISDTWLRTDAILLGVLLAIWSRHSSYRQFEPIFLRGRRAAGPALLAVGVGVLALVASYNLAPALYTNSRVTLVAIALVFMASYDRDYLWPAGLTKRVMIWIGSRSYGLYLIHVPAYFLTREIWLRILPVGHVPSRKDAARVILTALLLLIGLAEANYRLIETPLRQRGIRIAARFRQRAPAGAQA
jgi:peptidoglycan/LPS O-acetylase OafA/YrhL